MQEIIRAALARLALESRSQEDILFYIRGFFECSMVISSSLKQSKLDNPGQDTDPLYAHTWNYAIDTLTELLDKGTVEAHRGLPSEFRKLAEELEVFNDDSFPKGS